MLEKMQKLIDALQYEVAYNDYFSEEGFEYIIKKIKELKSLIHQMHKDIQNYRFANQEEEIYFFKHLKPQVIKEFIFMNWLQKTYETTSAYSLQNREVLKELLAKLNELFIEEREFYRYVKSGETVSDVLYFTRLKPCVSVAEKYHYYINFDSKINCSHGHLKAQLMAYEELQHYLIKRLSFLKKQEQVLLYTQSQSTVTWTGSKIEAVELIYALYYSQVLNHGNLSITKISQLFDELLGTDLSKNIYRDLVDIKNRKSETTKFLTKLKKILSKNING